MIWSYRLTGYAWVDFFIGTVTLAFLALAIGEFSRSLALLALRKHLDRITQETVRYQNLSVDALGAGDKQAYRAANKLANEAFGQSFFNQIALSAAFLWPVFFALAWMGYRFFDLEVPVPFTGYNFGYIGVFIILYVAAYPLFNRVKDKLPFFRRIKEIQEATKSCARAMKSFADLGSPATPLQESERTTRKASP